MAKSAVRRLPASQATPTLSLSQVPACRQRYAPPGVCPGCRPTLAGP